MVVEPLDDREFLFFSRLRVVFFYHTQRSFFLGHYFGCWLVNIFLIVTDLTGGGTNKKLTPPPMMRRLFCRFDFGHPDRFRLENRNVGTTVLCTFVKSVVVHARASLQLVRKRARSLK